MKKVVFIAGADDFVLCGDAKLDEVLLFMTAIAAPPGQESSALMTKTGARGGGRREGETVELLLPAREGEQQTEIRNSPERRRHRLLSTCAVDALRLLGLSGCVTYLAMTKMGHQGMFGDVFIRRMSRTYLPIKLKKKT